MNAESWRVVSLFFFTVAMATLDWRLSAIVRELRAMNERKDRKP